MSCTMSASTPAAISSRACGGLQFVVVNQGIERGMHPHAVTVGILRDAGDLLRAVARRMARPELRTADIDGVGAVIHGSDGRLQISGGSE